MTETATELAHALAPHKGDWMRKALAYSGTTAKTMANYLDVEAETVSRWINGKREPSKQTLRLWAMRCGVPLAFLETGEIPEDWNGPAGGSSAVTGLYQSHKPQNSGARITPLRPTMGGTRLNEEAA